VLLHSITEWPAHAAVHELQPLLEASVAGTRPYIYLAELLLMERASCDTSLSI
jgi:hypothetical protein